MKKLTLNQAWTLCLKQWKWIIGELDKGDEGGIRTLERVWCEKHKYEKICSDCFFCEYNNGRSGCAFCPAKIIDKNFNCCCVGEYNFFDNPRAFYAKLLSLNEKRLKGKKK